MINSFTYYYVITASNILGEGAASPQASATPMPTFTGGADDDHWVLRRSGSRLQIWIGDGSGTPAYDVPYASVGSLTFDGAGGNDMLTLDGADADDFAGVPIAYSGAGDDDTLVLRGASTASVEFSDGSGAQTIVVDGGSFTFAADIAAATSDATLAVTGGAAVTLSATQRLAGVVVDDNATLTLAADGSRVLSTAALSITNGGRLDLRDNDLIVRGGDLGSWTGVAYTGITGLIASGHNGGAWDGAGIVTGQPDAAAGLTTLASATAEQVLGIAAGETALWNGQPVNANDILVKYTYAGDANLDGFISGDDYASIDFNVAVPGSDGWYNGDFNFDGIISGDDYAAIDSNIVAQGEPL